MKKWSKRSLRLFLCSLLSLLIVAGATPMVFAAGADTEEQLDSGSKILALDKQKPKELDNMPDNVYDVEEQQPFLLSEQNELALLVWDSNNDSKKMYRMDNLDLHRTAKDEDGTCWVNGPTVKNAESNSFVPEEKLEIYETLSCMQSIGVDRDGTGRKQYIASVGFSGSSVMLVVQNASTGAIKTYAIAGAESASGTPYWLKDNYLAITAGDYDGDGTDSIVIYFCGDNDTENNDTARLIEFYPSGDTGWSKRTVVKMSSVVQNKTYLSNTHYRFKPVVSLATGDFTGDGRDQLAFSAGFYNTSDSKKYGYDDGLDCSDLSDLKQFASCVGICDHTSSGWSMSEPIWLYDIAEECREQNGNKSYYDLTIMHGASIAAGDVNNDDIDEIVAAGYWDDKAEAVYVNDEMSHVNNICDWSGSKLVSAVVYKTKNGYRKSKLQTFNMNQAQQKPYNNYCMDDDYCFAKLAMACAKTNGNNCREDVFIAGIVYNFENFTPKEAFTPKVFSDEDNYLGSNCAGMAVGGVASVTWIRNVAVGNFNSNEGGREQFVFTVWQKWKGQDDYFSIIGIITGSDFKDTKENGKITSFGKLLTYACNLNPDTIKTTTTIGNIDDNINGSLLHFAVHSDDTNLAVPVAVDIDDDGIMGRFSKSGYVYTDPEVMAVLEAAPYFEEIDDLNGYADPCETKYSITTGYGTGETTGDNVSFEAGIAAEVSGPAIKTSLEMGYTMDWSHTYEKSFKKEYTNEFTAKGQDVVVISRIPQLVYTYDLYNPKTNKWIENGYNVRVPMSPRVYKLSIKEYNKFVDQYNAMVKNDNKYTLKKVVMGTDLPKDHEGNPSNYWKNWTGGKQLSVNQYNLDHTGGATACEYSEETEETESEEMSHGFHYGLTVQGGGDFVVGEAWAGGYANLDYSHSTGHSTTSVNTKSSGGKVEDINEKAIKLPGLTTAQKNAVIENFTFAWTFGKFEKRFIQNGPYVPIYGYVVTGVGRPKDINNAKVVLSATSLTYNGKVQKPTIKTIGGKTLKAGRDYKAVWSNASSKNAGTYKVTIYGLNGYMGTTKATYKIVNPAVTLSKTSFAYNGKAQKPTVTVKYDTKTLKSGTDYTVTWPSNVTAVGTKNVKITLKGSYSGTKTVSYKIIPGKPAVPTVVNANKGLKITWKKTAGAGGYKVYRSADSGKTYKLAKTTDASTLTWTDTASNTNGSKYMYKILAYKTVSGTNYNSAYSGVRTYYKVTRPAAPTLANSTAGKLTVTWAKNTKASGYKIKCVTATTTKTITIKGSATVKKVLAVTKGKTYKVSVMAYKTVSGVTYNSAWSPVKSLKITK